MEIIDYILAAFRALFGLIIAKWFFAIAAPLCLVVERSIQYYYTAHAEYKSPEDKQAAVWKYIIRTLLMIACTALLFVWIFDDYQIRTKMLLIGAAIWYVYTLVLTYYFVRDMIKSRRRGSEKL